MKKTKKIKFAVPEEDIQYIKEIRVYNVRIPLAIIMREIIPMIKKGKICLNCGEEKKGKLTDWCDVCLETC